METMTSVLASVGSIFTQALTWAGETASAIAGEPLLLIFTIIPLVGLGIGIFKRLIS